MLLSTSHGVQSLHNHVYLQEVRLPPILPFYVVVDSLQLLHLPELAGKDQRQCRSLHHKQQRLRRPHNKYHYESMH